ncbi:hypothetical protein [Haematospirillum sp. H4890]|nr:hypothetical protein [Haematospirillum sp. H4890]
MKKNYLGPVLGLIELVTALVKLAYWIEKLVTVTANYLRRPIEN